MALDGIWHYLLPFGALKYSALVFVEAYIFYTSKRISVYNQYHGLFQLVVVPGLFLGDLDDATDVEKLKRIGIKTVVSLCDDPLPLPLLLRTGTITSLGLEAYKNMIFNF